MECVVDNGWLLFFGVLLFSFLLLEVAKWVMLGTNVIPLLHGSLNNNLKAISQAVYSTHFQFEEDTLVADKKEAHKFSHCSEHIYISFIICLKCAIFDQVFNWCHYAIFEYCILCHFSLCHL